MKFHLKKRVIFPLFALFSVILWMWFQCVTYDARFQKEVEYYAQINELIKDEPFLWARIRKDGIRLWDENRVLIKTIDFPGYRWQYRPECYRDSKDDVVFFVIHRAVDDEIGVLFVNDPEKNRHLNCVQSKNTFRRLSILDLDALGGIKQVRRVGPNSYYYNMIY